MKKAQEVVARSLPVVPITNAMELFGHNKTLGGVENYIKHPWCHDQINAYRPLELYRQ